MADMRSASIGFWMVTGSVGKSDAQAGASQFLEHLLFNGPEERTPRWSPAFRPEEFESERQVILEEILMHADEPADLVHDVLASAMFPQHPLGREVLGSAASVSAMTRDHVAEFHSC